MEVHGESHRLLVSRGQQSLGRRPIPKQRPGKDSSVATTSCVSFSYTTKSQINPINPGKSPSAAGRIVNPHN